MLYPIGIQTFSDIREGGYVYVDKTAQIYNLASTGKYYFLSRPRRFGKSLLVSTMEAYFKGKKELFEGLAIASLEKEWTEYPVLHFDLGGRAYDRGDVLEKTLDDAIYKWEGEYGIDNSSDILGIRFSNVIESACRTTGRQVVILIDEYDKPIIDNL
ncbi:MAG: AAA family ATPase, partial [Bacteroidia bacterium]|nr:AAA family ATPase [Bacteroidia bacterium]